MAPKGKGYTAREKLKMRQGGKKMAYGKMSYGKKSAGGKPPYHVTKKNLTSRGTSGGNPHYTLTKKGIGHPKSMKKG